MSWRIKLGDRTWTDQDFIPSRYNDNFPLFFQAVADLVSEGGGGGGGGVPVEQFDALKLLVQSLRERIEALENGEVVPPEPEGFSFDFSQPSNSGYLLLFPI